MVPSMKVAAGFAVAGIVEPDAGAACSAAHASSASALVPLMSELKPPSQNSPGEPPARARTAMRREARALADLDKGRALARLQRNWS